jgi:transposase
MFFLRTMLVWSPPRVVLHLAAKPKSLARNNKPWTGYSGSAYRAADGRAPPITTPIKQTLSPKAMREIVWPVINLSSRRIAAYLNEQGVKSQPAKRGRARPCCASRDD